MGVETAYFVVLFMRTKLGSGALFDKLQNSFTKQQHPPTLCGGILRIIHVFGK